MMAKSRARVLITVSSISGIRTPGFPGRSFLISLFYSTRQSTLSDITVTKGLCYNYMRCGMRIIVAQGQQYLPKLKAPSKIRLSV